MFKNKRALQVTVVKTPKNQTVDTEEQKPFMTKDEAHAIARDMIKHTAITVVAVMAASVVLHTAGELLIRALEVEANKKEN